MISARYLSRVLGEIIGKTIRLTLFKNPVKIVYDCDTVYLILKVCRNLTIDINLSINIHFLAKKNSLVNIRSLTLFRQRSSAIRWVRMSVAKEISTFDWFHVVGLKVLRYKNLPI